MSCLFFIIFYIYQNAIAWTNYENILLPNIIAKEADLEKVYAKIDDYQVYTNFLNFLKIYDLKLKNQKKNL